MLLNEEKRSSTSLTRPINYKITITDNKLNIMVITQLRTISPELENLLSETKPLSEITAAKPIMKKQDNQSNDSNLDLSAADELLALKLKIKDFCIEFDKTSWGWDGDCGTQCLVDDLEETVKDKYDDWTC